MGWAEFAAAVAVFFLSHALPVRPPLRPRLEAALGARGFTLAYSALSLAVLAWLIGSAGRAPYVPLWSWAPWQAHVPLIAMLPACLIIALALGRPNPFSFGSARAERFDPARPGIVRWMRHPLLVALALWAFAHLVPNGNLAHVLMFGLFGAFAIVGGRLIDWRKRREMGAEWARRDAARRAGPLLPRPAQPLGAALRLVAGIGLYWGLIELHPVLFGVAPGPP